MAAGLAVGTGVLLAAAPVLGPQSDPRAAVQTLLAAYDAGKYDSVDAALASQPKGPLADELRRQGDRWVKTGPGESVDRRRLIAGAVALEIVAAGLRDEWKLVHPAIEWACKHVLATAPGSEAEHLWHLGALSLLHDGGVLGPTSSYVEGHLTRHSLKRFPSSPHIQLGVVTDQERDVYVPMRRTVRLPEIPFEDMQRFWGRSAEVVKQYTALMSVPDVGEEARLRLGAFYIRLGIRPVTMEMAETTSARSDRVDAAITVLAPLLRTADPYAGYVAAFLTGNALRHKNRTAEAAAAYRQALTFVPNAMSASLGLSSVLAEEGHVESAISAVSGAAMTTAPVDPWRIFAFGDGRLWPQWRDGLRREMRR